MKYAAIVTLLLALPSFARAYSLGTSVSDPCHERLTLEALSRTTPPSITPAQDDTWPRLADYLSRSLDRDPESNPEDAARLLASVLGVRAPDLQDVAPTDIDGLRHIHLDDALQAEHFLRRSAHDYAAGNELAADDANALLRQLIEESAAAYDADPDGQNLRSIRVWVDGYGTIELRVWEPLFIAAKGLHLVQDSFSHTFRSDDAQRVLSVHNYVDPLLNDYDPARDGPGHLSVFDGCTDAETAPLREAAVAASADFLQSLFTYWQARNPRPLDDFFDTWMSVDTNCGACTSRWVTIASRQEALSQAGCTLSRAGSRGSARSEDSSPTGALSLILIAALALLRPRRQ